MAKYWKNNIAIWSHCEQREHDPQVRDGPAVWRLPPHRLREQQAEPVPRKVGLPTLIEEAKMWYFTAVLFAWPKTKTFL